MSGGVCRRQGIIHRPLAAFGHPSPHNHSGIRPTQSLAEHTHTMIHTHSFDCESCVNWTGRKSMTTNSHMFTVQRTTFGAFCVALSSPSPLSATSLGIMEVFGKNSPVNIATLFKPPHSSLLDVCVFLQFEGVLVLQKYKARSMC